MVIVADCKESITAVCSDKKSEKGHRMGLLPLMKQCCCKGKLRTGSEFCGWWGAIFGTLTFLVFTAVLMHLMVTDYRIENARFIVWGVFVIFGVIMSLLRMWFSVNFLIEIYQGKENNRLPWVIVCNAVYLAGYIWVLFVGFGDRLPSVIVLGIFIAMCTECYFILVMNSDHWQQKADERVRIQNEQNQSVHLI